MRLFKLLLLIAAAVIMACPVSAKSPKEKKKKSKTTTETVVRHSLDPNEEITLRVDMMPQFGKKGSINDFRNWVTRMIKTPKPTLVRIREKGQPLTVMVVFVVSKEGYVCNVDTTVGKKPLGDEDLKREIERVMYMSPKWVPAVQNGRNVNVRYAMPINFNPW